MTAQQPGSAPRALAPQSEVQAGDTLATGRDAYALVRFIDQSEMALKPATTLKVEQFVFDNALPDNDSAGFRLVKGGLRSVTGLLGQRNKERFALKTPSATIGIRGTTFFLEYLAGDEAAAGLASASPLEPGLHVYVGEGGLSLVNQAGVFRYDAGQFGYFKDEATAPVKMPSNPGMRFDLPPGFGPATLPPKL
ncbi:FecR family protein [Pseudoduganella namucuonensis]|uniref:FecR family protein n=2 Tax=Pseudoduganella namucuonensis TaxID=1035707 RepID=A0A1I7IW19_9BURK|nr:FecR family protein [Pseudoduganella namucuonensis]